MWSLGCVLSSPLQPHKDPRMCVGQAQGSVWGRSADLWLCVAVTALSPALGIITRSLVGGESEVPQGLPLSASWPDASGSEASWAPDSSPWLRDSPEMTPLWPACDITQGVLWYILPRASRTTWFLFAGPGPLLGMRVCTARPCLVLIFQLHFLTPVVSQQ